MYNAQTTKERIKLMCRSKKINMENMLLECALGVNAIRQINDTRGIASFSLAKIADYLDCSVDFLLGRTDNPELQQKVGREYTAQEYLDKLDREQSFAELIAAMRIANEITPEAERKIIESLHVWQ